jgi:hypothetical protein
MRVAGVKRFRAWLLLATFVTTLGLTGLSPDHLGIIDIACGAVGFVPADRATHVGPASEGDPQHCPVCHFQRAASGACTASVVRVWVQAESAIIQSVPGLDPVIVDRPTRSSRGPPAFTLPTVS